MFDFRYIPVYITCALVASIILVVDLNLPLGVASGVPYILVILFSLWTPQKNFTLLCAAVCSLLTITGFYFSPPGGELWKVIFNRSLALFAIWVTAILSLQRKQFEAERQLAEGEREEALAELKVLRGIIPICSSCRNIRDDAGSWKRIEAYLREHSEVEFSHGVCPDCAKKLYPEYVSSLES